MLRRRSEKVLGRKRAHWHGMRHGQAVGMRLRDVALQDIQQCLGHEHLSTTEIYLQGLMPMGVMEAGRSNNWLAV
jgi:site-specific recombinase XerD